MFDNPINILSVGASLGLMAAGVGFAYAQFTSGASKAKDDLINTLKETANVERDKAARLAEEKTTLITSHQVQINDLNQQIGKLQGIAEANERKLKEYVTILQGRNPEQIKILNEIREFMKQINDELAKSNRFNHSIDKATKKGQGKPLLKKA